MRAAGAGVNETKVERPPLTVVRAPERPARDELEAFLIGWQIRKPEWFGGPAANSIFRDLQAGFSYSDTLLSDCQRAIDSAVDDSQPVTPQHIAARIAVDNHEVQESSLFEFLRSYSLGAPAAISEPNLRQQIASTLNLLREAARADRRRQAHEMLLAGGIDVFEDVRALVEEPPINPVEQVCLSAAEWCERDLESPDFLLGQLLSTTSRLMLVAPTGLGKTNFALQMTFCVAAGSDFLHWRGRRPARALFIDGEMSRRLMRSRIADAARRHGGVPENLFILCRDDVPDMPPLNTPEGQAFIDAQIIKLGGLDFIIFDNVQALLVGDMKDEESWQQTLPWIKSLTSRSIGQIWVHHTGLDKSRSYGTSTREWQLDTVALMEAVEQPGADIAFMLKFLKARERAPNNRDDFEPVIVTLAQNKWTYERCELRQACKTAPLTSGESGWLKDLVGLFAEPAAPLEIVVPALGMPPQETLTRDQVREGFKRKGRLTLNPNGALTNADRQKIHASLNALKDKGKIGMTERHVWLLQERQ